MTVKISIIIPVYKVKEYLDKCINSILEQEFNDYEIILIDDGSPDNCGKICDSYADKHPEKIKVIHQENRGLSGARNTGLLHTAGEYILFVDSDDYVSSDMLTKLDAAINKYNSPDMVVFGHISVVEKYQNVVSEPVTPDIVTDISKNKELLHAGVTAWSRIVKRELYEGILFPKRAIYEDLHTIPKLLLLAKSVVYINEQLYYYLKRADSIMGSSNDGRYLERINAINEIVEYYKKNDAYQKYYDELCFLAVMHIADSAVVDIMSISKHSPSIEKIRKFMEEKFPDYNENKYLKKLSADRLRRVKKLHDGKLKSLETDYRIREILKKIIVFFFPSLIRLTK